MAGVVLGGCFDSQSTGAGAPNPPADPSSDQSTSAADTAPPDVSLTAPVAGGNVSGTVLVSAVATDNVGVEGVQFRLDDQILGAEDTSAPYSVSWDTATLAPGSVHTLTAVARDAARLFAASVAVQVTVQAPPPVPAGIIFLDNFEYVVGRTDPNAAGIFSQPGRWAAAKTQQSSSGNGYLYTVDAIPGFTGAFPGNGSGRVLSMEALPHTLNGQTDYYLQFGSGDLPVGQIPANHWYQFWVYPANTNGQQSLYSQGKFIYPNRASFYPASLNNDGYVYIFSLSKGSAAPLHLDPCPGGDAVGCPSFSLHTAWNRANGITNNIEYEEGSFGANLASDIHAPPNQWTLVKIHIDLSGTDPRVAAGQAVYEMWIRRAGSPTWIKTTEYLGGVTVVNNAPINFIPAFNDGFRMIRIPTTFGATTDAKGDWFDSWTYLDDFAIAGNEAALPQY